MDSCDSIYSRSAELLRNAHSVFVMTGAGISAESGVPTFRGTDGLWKKYSAQDLATPEAFSRNPALVWEWYQWRQDIIRKARPNAGHLALVHLEDRCGDFLLLTQNVDGLHQRAGSRNVLELHGNIFRVRCPACGAFDECARKSLKGVPVCSCGGMMRPDVVWFGEAIPSAVWHEALEFLSRADVAIFCGTSGLVWPAAGIPDLAKQRGVKTIEINPEPTPKSAAVDIALKAEAGKALPMILERLAG